MAELLQISGKQNPGAVGTLQFTREGGPAGFQTDSEGNVTCTTLTVNGVPVTGAGTPSVGGYPISAYGFHSASDDPAVFTGASTIPDAGAFYARIYVPAGKAITVVAAMVKTAGTLGAGGRNGFAVFDDTGAQLGTTPDDNNLWLSTGWVIKALSTPIPAATTERFLFGGAGCAGYTVAPNIAYLTNGNTAIITGGGYNVTNHRRAFYDASTSWPASFNPASYGTDPGGYLPLICFG